MCIPDRLWYFVATLIAWAYFAESRDSPLLRRPSWAPVWLLRAARKWCRLFIFCMTVLGMLLATDLVEVFWLRAAYGIFVLLADFVYFAAYGGHVGFIFLYTALAMTLSAGSARAGVLRLIVAHQLGSPALNKLRIGGWKWLDPSTLESHIRFVRDQELPFKPHRVVEPPWMRQHWMMDLCLRHQSLLALLHWAGLTMQFLVVLACLFGGQVALYLACAAACGFHVFAAPLLGIVFPFSIPCYMLALLPSSAHDVACLWSLPALVTALLLGGTTVLATEDWPLNALAVFPYNAEQMQILESIFGRYLLAHSEGEPRDAQEPRSFVSAYARLIFIRAIKAIKLQPSCLNGFAAVVASSMNGQTASQDTRVVALVADRSYGLVISLLGVLRAGKAYTPIEPDFPPARAISMLEAADISFALVPALQVPQPVLHDCKGLRILAVHDDGRVCQAEDDHPLPRDFTQLQPVPDSATAYVLFTSGSTGKPKGCMVPHRGSALYAQAVVDQCHLDENMVFLLKTPYVFDVSIQDLFTAFCAGGTLEIADPGAHKDAGAIAEIIGSRGVNCACFVPTLLVEFVNYLERNPDEVQHVRQSLRRVLTIGEALMTATCAQILSRFPELEIHNLYGPTEASVGVSHFEVTAGNVESLGTVVPIGRPFSYVNFCVFDPSSYADGGKIEESSLKLAAPGTIGELFIGGDCLASGYIKNPEKTEAAFFSFPGLCPRAPEGASPFTLYKTGDLCKVENGVFHYMGRNDFQVKISGVRVECEEVSAVLKTHPVVGDALVTAFDGPFGKALAAYVVTTDTADWSQEMSQGAQDEDEILNVSSWGAVYDEMYKETDNSVSAQDPTLNWSGYTDTYSRRPHIEPVIKEWVEWSCEQVSAHADLLREGSWRKGRPTITELGCGNGMLLFRLAPLLGQTGRYQHLNVDTKALAAHEIFEVVQAKENDIVLCNGVTMYFPTANYLLKCMQLSAEATRDGGLVVYGDIQSRRHVLAFRAHVETYQALRRQDATASAVLHAAKQSVAGEELSYFDDALFHRLDRNGHGLFQNRLARVELRVKRGWWHSEFNRFRYDVWLVLGEKESREPQFEMISYEQVQQELQLCNGDANELVDSRLVEKLEDWVAQRLKDVESAGELDGFVVTLPNARTFHATRLLEWLETAAAALEPVELSSLPGLLHPADACSGSARESAKFGVEPEMLFTLALPQGWEQRVIWAEDPGFLRFVVLKSEASKCSWLAAATAAPREELPEDLSAFKNQPEDVEFSFNPVKACNDLMKAWAAGTSLLPAMRPSVYIPLEAFPKNAAGKIDRAALPDAVKAFEEISTTAAAEYEPPSTEEERTMVEIWEKVLKVQVGVLTPFVAYGGHSLTAVQLCSSVNAAFNQ
ncbi:cmdD, partial [Symbiodinium sp. CCMP2456]